MRILKLIMKRDVIEKETRVLNVAPVSQEYRRKRCSATIEIISERTRFIRPSIVFCYNII